MRFRAFVFLDYPAKYAYLDFREFIVLIVVLSSGELRRWLSLFGAGVGVVRREEELP